MVNTRPISMAGAAMRDVSNSRPINFSVHSNVSLVSHPRRVHFFDFTAPVQTALEHELFTALYYVHMPQNHASWQSMLIAWNHYAASNASTHPTHPDMIIRPKLLRHLKHHYQALVSTASISDLFYPMQRSRGGSVHGGQNMESGIMLAGPSNLHAPIPQSTLLPSAAPVRPPTSATTPVTTASAAGTLPPLVGGSLPIRTSAAPIILPGRRVQQQPAVQRMAPVMAVAVDPNHGHGLQHRAAGSGLGRGGRGKGKTCSSCRHALKGARDRGEQHVSREEWNAGKRCTVPATGRNRQVIACAICGGSMATHTTPCSQD